MFFHKLREYWISDRVPNLSNGSKPWKASRKKVSHIHEQEARERYWILRRDIEIHIETFAAKMNTDFIRYEEGENISKYIEEREKELKRAIVSKFPNKNSKCWEEYKKIVRPLYYYKILLLDVGYISNRLDHLNMLWRDMNFIRTRMLSEEIIDAERIPYQLDFCRSEATNMDAQSDPEVKSLMNQAAEELNPKDQTKTNNIKAIRYITSLMVKLNDMRVKKLSEQVYKKSLYMTLLLILLTFSFCIFFLDDFLVSYATRSEHNNEVSPSSISTNYNPARTIFSNSIRNNSDLVGAAIYCLKFPNAELHSEIFPINILMFTWNSFVWVVELILGLIVSYPTIFIFFAGLTGGFFSALLKTEPVKKAQGDELFLRWYYITKPFIGAFGAMIIYIVVTTGLFNLDFIKGEIVQRLVYHPISGTGFTFAFLTGFTERIILPKLK
ncbi:MAG: hypothetical protein P8X90_29495 [Desulfobacterales bacterium]